MSVRVRVVIGEFQIEDFRFQNEEPTVAASKSSICNHKSEICNGLLLYGRSAAKLEQNLVHGLGQWAIDRATAGAFVAAAAKTLGDMGHIEFALTAQAYAVSAARQLAEERRHLDAADRKDVVHQPFAVFFNRAAEIHLLLRHPHTADVSLD